MQVGRVLVVVIACGGTARADVAGEVSAGAGGDTTAPGGFAAASAAASASLERAAPPIERRGDFAEDPTGEHHLWVFTGLDPEDRDSVGVAGDATLHLQPDADVMHTAWLSGRVWARHIGWQIEARGAFQPVGNLRERMWRSGRDVLQTNLSFEIPAMWAIGTARTQLLAFLPRFDLGKRSERRGANWVDAGFDTDVEIIGMRLQHPSVTVDVFDGHFVELGVARRTTDMTTYGTTASAMDIDLAAVTWRAAPDLIVSARGGLVMRQPVAPYTSTGSSQQIYGAVALAGNYWLDVRHGTALDPGARGYTAGLGAGSWTRLDPTGHAVDSGQLAAADADWRDGRYRLGASVQLGRLRRILIGDLAPDGLVPVGTRMVMGRGSVVASVRVTGDVAITATTWLERSDRDDPRWLVPATGALTMHAGADVNAQWRFRRW